MKKVISTCIYCGCGCKLSYNVQGNKIIKINGYKRDDISEAKPCIKGLTINEVFNKNRINFPYIRKNKKLVKVSWDEALEVIYKKVKKTSSKDMILNGSGKITNEDNLLLYKIGSILLKTNNIDSCCGRLCHISTVKALQDSFGASNLTKMSNLDKLDTLFIIGSNPAITYPVFWNKVMRRLAYALKSTSSQALSSGAKKSKDKLKIVSVQPILNMTSKFGDNFLEIEPGTEVALLNGIMRYLIKYGSFNLNAVNIQNFKKLKKLVKKYKPNYVSKICHIKKDDFLEVCKVVAKSKKLGVFHGMNFTQHVNSLKNAHTLMNLVLLKNAQILTLRGEINVQGVGDIFSGDLKKLKKLWRAKPKKPKGNLVKSLLLNPAKVAFITEFNPAQSMPNLNKVHKNLEKMFVVYLGSYFNLTCDYADVILPLPALFESQGTITNGEQRIRSVKKVLNTGKLDLLEISKLFSKKFKKEKFFKYENYKQISKEIFQIVPEYNKLNVNKIYSGKDGFSKKEIKFKKFFPEKFKNKDEKRTKNFPFLLTTFREQHQFLTGEITSQSKTLRKIDKDNFHIFINPKDAIRLGIMDEDKVKVVSKSGEIESLARVRDNVPEKLLATRYHYKEILVNKLFASRFDSKTFTPNYKSVAVRIEKV